MAIINPTIALYCAAIPQAIFSMMMFIAPLASIAQWQSAEKQANMTLLEKLLVGAVVQFWGLNIAIEVCVLMITARNGTDEQKGTTCFMQGLSAVFGVIMMLLGSSEFLSLGANANGMYVNMGVYGTIGILNFLGASFPPAIKMAPLRHPMYWGLLGLIAMYTFYMLSMIFMTESLMKGYGVELEGQGQLLLTGVFRYGIPQDYFGVIMLLTGQIITAGSLATYGIVRYLCVVVFGMITMCLTMCAVWTCLNEDGKYDKIISGQYFNFFLWLVFFFLFYVPIARMDPAIKSDVVEQVESKNESLSSDSESATM